MKKRLLGGVIVAQVLAVGMAAATVRPEDIFVSCGYFEWDLLCFLFSGAVGHLRAIFG